MYEQRIAWRSSLALATALGCCGVTSGRIATTGINAVLWKSSASRALVGEEPERNPAVAASTELVAWQGPLQRRIRYEPNMRHKVVIRPARPDDRDFVEGLVSSLLAFGSPAWRDPERLMPGFRAVLGRAVTAPESRAEPRA